MNTKNITLSNIPFYLGIVIIIFTCLILVHDYISSYLLNRSYYFSESLLFTVKYLIFVLPLIYLQISKQKNTLLKQARKYNIKTILSVLIPISIIHIIVSSIIISLISQALFDSPYTLEFLLKNKFVNNFIIVLILYLFLLNLGKALIDHTHWQQSQVKPKSEMNHRLSIKSGNKIELINQYEIQWITAQTPYIEIQLAEKNILHLSSLTKMLSQLDHNIFVRIHRSTVVNLRFIKSLNSRSNGDYDLQLYDGNSLRLSRNYREQLISKLNQLS